VRLTGHSRLYPETNRRQNQIENLYALNIEDAEIYIPDAPSGRITKTTWQLNDVTATILLKAMKSGWNTCLSCMK
jgi:hypothetical protein